MTCEVHNAKFGYGRLGRAAWISITLHAIVPSQNAHDGRYVLNLRSFGIFLFFTAALTILTIGVVTLLSPSLTRQSRKNLITILISCVRLCRGGAIRPRAHRISRCLTLGPWIPCFKVFTPLLLAAEVICSSPWRTIGFRNLKIIYKHSYDTSWV